MIRSVGEKRKEIDCGQKERGYEYDDEDEEGSAVLRSSSSFPAKNVSSGAVAETNILVNDGKSGADESAAQAVHAVRPKALRSRTAASCFRTPTGETPPASL